MTHPALANYSLQVSAVSWQIDGTVDTNWPRILVNELVTVPSSELEAVNESSLMINPALNPDSGGSTCYSGAAKKR